MAASVEGLSRAIGYSFWINIVLVTAAFLAACVLMFYTASGANPLISWAYLFVMTNSPIMYGFVFASRIAASRENRRRRKVEGREIVGVTPSPS